MVFSSPVFLFGFLPLCLLAYYLSPRVARNTVLLAFSLGFYAWGETFYVMLMLVSILWNYLVGRALAQAISAQRMQREWQLLVLGVAGNLALLVSFKYASFIVTNLNLVLGGVGLRLADPELHLPLGISFFTFQAISYLVDIHRRQAESQRNPLDLGLYISLFPQLIAGPIVRYNHLAGQITQRHESVELFASGVQRFTHGLAKKVLLANPMGEVADAVFALPSGELTTGLVWVGILAYTLQIYFDFSGYSDMAIGLGRMFGFRFLENFNYPYVARSIREFWRRWHISLSTWFRDYVYIPLGGNRVATRRVYLNLLVVFCLTGIWHGAQWNFLVWGLFHGCFLALEHAGASTVVARLWRPLQHVYVLLVVVVGWVFFRADDLPTAMHYLQLMFVPGVTGTTGYQLAQVLNPEFYWCLVAGLLLSLPLFPALVAWFKEREGRALSAAGSLANTCLLALLFILSAASISASTYNPFIYFRF